MLKKKKIFLFLVLLSWLILPVVTFAALNKLTNLKVQAIGKHTRIIFSLSGALRYNIFTLKKPNRVVVDFSNTKLATAIKKVKLAGSTVKSIRTGIYKKQDLRIVFELKQALQPASFVQKARGRRPNRLVVDLMPRQKQVVQKKAVITAKNNKNKLRNVYIIIDPGHGGSDPGAIGAGKTQEKNVVLAIAKDLNALLKKQSGFTPKLTRKGNYYVSLRNRLKLARKGQADLFVSIHADAYKNRSARGVSVYALSERGATSEAARWLAKKENYSELMGGVILEDKSYDLRSVLIDLSQTATTRSSLKLGSNIMLALQRVAILHRNRVEQAPFVVLKSPDIPSLLIEVGFISNRKEEMQLRTNSYQRKIAAAIMLGIVNYFHKYPPPDTYLATMKKGQIKYRVRRGDNLSAIAKRFGMSAKKLMQFNNLKSSGLAIGQTLEIPKS
jgi:N-acetylmuramoyl-L-alanine amidase